MAPFLYVMAERTGFTRAHPERSPLQGRRRFAPAFKFDDPVEFVEPAREFSSRAFLYTYKKSAGGAFFICNGGADGTRTRDLRRDRPAF